MRAEDIDIGHHVLLLVVLLHSLACLGQGFLSGSMLVTHAHLRASLSAAGVVGGVSSLEATAQNTNHTVLLTDLVPLALSRVLLSRQS